ncbi:hypothetical protein E2A64_03560 [Pseudohoeflea suaedae]|uniref:DUF1475 domain-containing protein n=1 Tax=Pseudohoeflea suaedae TaxID=877384 RepID=A0A4R5PMR4_9HYPH|nr:hypothetical protein [Pseudohoeflea suaedae]TDH38209.1 hypothetical protein E2A64_03560 [Pseudohoeflea suaedae]
MTPLRLLIAVLALAFAVLIVWAIGTGTFSEAGAWLVSEPWGLVSMADLYLGFLLSSTVIFFFERRWWVAALWIFPIPFLGNVWTAVWFVLRLPEMARRLGRT